MRRHTGRFVGPLGRNSFRSWCGSERDRRVRVCLNELDQERKGQARCEKNAPIRRDPPELGHVRTTGRRENQEKGVFISPGD